jgi:hypothetical protein
MSGEYELKYNIYASDNCVTFRVVLNFYVEKA